jgi:hypothetical protein
MDHKQTSACVGMYTLAPWARRILKKHSEILENKVAQVESNTGSSETGFKPKIKYINSEHVA